MAAAAFAGCGEKNQTEQPTEVATEAASTLNNTVVEGLSKDEQDEFFKSMMGAYVLTRDDESNACQMTIRDDGSFEGTYRYYNTENTGDGYPNGTITSSDFSGYFGGVIKVDDNTYTMRLGDITYKQAPGTEEIKDSTKYSYTTAYGLHDTGSFTVFTPDTPISGLPAIYYNTVVAPKGIEGDTLGRYGIFNESLQDGFLQHITF